MASDVARPRAPPPGTGRGSATAHPARITPRTTVVHAHEPPGDTRHTTSATATRGPAAASSSAGRRPPTRHPFHTASWHRRVRAPPGPTATDVPRAPNTRPTAARSPATADDGTRPPSRHTYDASQKPHPTTRSTGLPSRPSGAPPTGRSASHMSHRDILTLPVNKVRTTRHRAKPTTSPASTPEPAQRAQPQNDQNGGSSAHPPAQGSTGTSSEVVRSDGSCPHARRPRIA